MIFFEQISQCSVPLPWAPCCYLICAKEVQRNAGGHGWVAVGHCRWKLSVSLAQTFTLPNSSSSLLVTYMWPTFSGLFYVTSISHWFSTVIFDLLVVRARLRERNSTVRGYAVCSSGDYVDRLNHLTYSTTNCRPIATLACSTLPINLHSSFTLTTWCS